MNIYQIDFDYTFALADIRASVDGADSMEFSQERPELIDKFKYDWVTTDSELIPDFVVIMSELLGCKTGLKSKVEELSQSFKFHDLKIGDRNYTAFINIGNTPACIYSSLHITRNGIIYGNTFITSFTISLLQWEMV